MTEFNVHQTEELNQASGLMDDHLRLREEIERQLEVEREAGRAMAEGKLQREKLMRQATQKAMRQEEETLLRQASSTTAKHKRNSRPYSMDALMLCAVTLGVGALLGPIMRPAPMMYAPHYAAPPVAANPMPPGGMMNSPYVMSHSTDFGGTNWDGSRMIVDKEVALADGREYIQGHYDWNAGGDYVGSEQFSGSYNSTTGNFDVTGDVVVQPNMDVPQHLCRGHYTGTMTSDGQMLNGYMEGAPGINGVPGPLSAQQVTK